MSVSVIITTKNRSVFVRQAIESVLALGEGRFDLEVLVVDDGSTDDTATVLDSLPVQTITTDGIGMARARSLGLRRSTGDFVTFLDDDDVLLPSAITTQLDVFARHPEYAAVHAQAQCVRADLEPYGPPFPEGPLESGHILPELLGYFPQVATVLTRREAALEAGDFDAGLQGDNDWDWLLRIAARHPIGAVEVPVMLFRQRDEPDEELTRRRFPATVAIFHRHTAAMSRLRRIRLRRVLWRHKGWCASIYLNHAQANWRRGHRRRAVRSIGYAARVSPGHFVLESVRRVGRALGARIRAR